MEGLKLVTIIIIGINVLISYKGFNDRIFFDRYKFSIGSVRGGEKIRLLSAGFLHVDMTHLFINMLTLYFFANVVINTLGTASFIGIYIGSLILGNLFSLYFHKDEPLYSAVGASGAVMGIVYAAILLYPHMTLGLFFIVPMPAWLFGVGFMLFSIYGMKKRLGNIGHDAHFGGAAGGYFITLLMAPYLIHVHTLMTIILLIPIIALFIVYKAKLIK